MRGKNDFPLNADYSKWGFSMISVGLAAFGVRVNPACEGVLFRSCESMVYYLRLVTRNKLLARNE